ncbi:N-acetylmuramoyl-L-alanine amidase [Pararhizobium haloflavum]|uniref:N-acetylmuramoyl-L-alanine amidase n=1 Tax=Pararhizobium haloflavum TaxID=2037914 RepID=UPI001FDEB06B|nr:N-acetylmuramoyl-L-alanine amidase [Pararhizobium haloflavum]
MGARKTHGFGSGWGAALLVAALAVVIALSPPAQAADGVAKGDSHLAFAARIAGDQMRTRVVIDFESEPSYSVHYLDDPARVIIDLPETIFGFDDDALEPRGLFRAIRYGAMGPGRSRMVLSAVGPVELEMMTVEPREDGRGHRLVFDAVATSDRRFAELVSQQDWQPTGSTAQGDEVVDTNGPTGRKPFTIVLDPGHGGIDTGARGQAGTEEKDVTLAFAKAIAAELATFENIRVVLTREDDRFIPLAGRVRIARQHEADLMMSVHADSIRLPDIRGATVYTLSDKASDRMAAELARQENSVDELAGVAATEETADVADILMDLTRRETQVFSIGLARSVLDSLRGEIRLINNAHRFAGFSVLRAHDVPSLLVELGYLSNRQDERLLNDPAWRQQTARLLAKAIQHFREQIYTAAKDL